MRSTIYWINIDELEPCSLATSARPRGGDWLEDEIIGWKTAGVRHVASLLTASENTELELESEAQLCRAYGLGFTSVPVPDRGLPDSSTVFLGYAELLHQKLMLGRSVLVHCRQGIGRASLLAATIAGYCGLDGTAALEAIEAARGRSVPDTEEQRAWLLARVEQIVKSGRCGVGRSGIIR